MAAPARGIQVEWWPQERQLTFLRAMGLSHAFDGGPPGRTMADVVGYGGAAGGGKTDAFLVAALITVLTWPGAQVAYFRREYPELEGPGGAIPRAQVLYQPLRTAKHARWDATRHRWTFAGGGVIQFLHCQHADDVYAYQSQQFDLLLIDEATHFEEPMIAYLTSRNRLTVDMPAPICAIASNPGNVGHAWFRRVCRPEAPAGEVRSAQWEGSNETFTAAFFPARLEDNQALEQRDPGYRRKLEALPITLRDQLLYGRWDTFAGQVFAEWDYSVHVCRPFVVPRWWRRWLANDPGYTDPYAWYWMAADEEGNIWIYREFTRQPSEDRVPYSQQAAQVMALSLVGTEVPGGRELTGPDEQISQTQTVPERLDWCVTGMDAFNRHPETGKSIADYYREGGLAAGLIKPVHGPGARAAMAAAWHEYLRPFEGPDGAKTARLRIFSTCARLIETLPVLVADPNRPEQVAEMPIDHWYQGAGYGLQAWHATRSRPPTAPLSTIAAAKAAKAKALQAARRRSRQ